jgi:hypothetical protein
LIAGLISFLSALTKYKQDPGGLAATATAHPERNEAGRIRITEITIEIRVGKSGSELENTDNEFLGMAFKLVVTVATHF